MAACNRCEGNGQLWADRKVHTANYRGPTMDCPNCGGTGGEEEVMELKGMRAFHMANAQAVAEHPKDFGKADLSDAIKTFAEEYKFLSNDVTRLRSDLEVARTRVGELETELRSQERRWMDLPSGADLDADENDRSPVDSSAHIAGLAVRAIRKALEAK